MRSILYIAILLSITNSFSQEFNFGFKGGLNISNTWFDVNDFKSKGRAGGHLGLFSEIEFSQRIHMQLEAFYSREGDENVYLDYINVPLLLKVYPIKNRLYIETGPQLGFLQEVEGNDEGITKTNIVINLGAGYESKSGLFIGIRYGLGIRSLLQDKVIIETPGLVYNLGEITVLTQVFQISAGYKFKI